MLSQSAEQAGQVKIILLLSFKNKGNLVLFVCVCGAPSVSEKEGEGK